MRKLIVGLVFVLAGAVNAFGQSTTVSGQVTDNGSQSWNNATCQFQFVPNPNIPTFQSYTWTGGALSQVVNCTTNGSGAYSVSVPSNTAISPGGSKWILQVTPNATSPSFSTPATTITGGTQTLNVTPRAIAISWSLPPGPAISAYADAEITGTLPKGAEYFNTTTLLTRVWNGSAWANQGSGSGSGCTPSGGAGVVQASNGSGGCEATSITDNGTTVTTAENFQALGNASTLSTIIAGAHQLNGITVTGGSGTTVSAIESGQTLILDADAGISMTINSGRIAANGDFVNIGNTSTGLISGLAQGPTSANVLEVTPSATTVAADESGGTVSIAANSNVSITSSTGQVQLTPGSGSFIALGSAVTVPPAGTVAFSSCGLGERQDRVPTASTDTILATDRCGRVAYNASGAVAVTLPNTTTTGFGSEFWFYVANANTASSAVTITPTGTTINGAATLVLNLGDWCVIGENTAGTAYNANCAPSQLIAGTGITLTPGVHSLTIAASGSAGANTALSNLASVAINAALLPGTTNSIALGSGTFEWSNIFATAHDCGIAGTTSCVFTGHGSTGGAATITWPAVAGTSTNPITFSNVISGPVGTATSPTFQLNATGNGVYLPFANQPAITASGAAAMRWNASGSGIFLAAANGFIWTTGADAVSGTNTVVLSKSPTLSTVLAIGTLGSLNSTTGGMELSYLQTAGTKFTASGCSNSTTLGGASAGQFASGTTGACTVTITMGDSDTALNGWSCDASDQTTPANLISQKTGGSTTTAVITGTTVSGDVISFKCAAY